LKKNAYTIIAMASIELQHCDRVDEVKPFVVVAKGVHFGKLRQRQSGIGVADERGVRFIFLCFFLHTVLLCLFRALPLAVAAAAAAARCLLLLILCC